MKPSTKTTLSRKPQGATEQCGVARLQQVVDLCFLAFVLDIRLEEFPTELKKLLSDDVRERIVREIAKTTRMVSFITYHGDHMSVEISFYESSKVAKSIRVRFGYSQKQLIFISEATL
ncbi:MAG: hypothetical protein WC087_03965 [Candidatus Paceibacterota bacterium]